MNPCVAADQIVWRTWVLTTECTYRHDSVYWGCFIAQRFPAAAEDEAAIRSTLKWHPARPTPASPEHSILKFSVARGVSSQSCERRMICTEEAIAEQVGDTSKTIRPWYFPPMAKSMNTNAPGVPDAAPMPASGFNGKLICGHGHGGEW